MKGRSLLIVVCMLVVLGQGTAQVANYSGTAAQWIQQGRQLLTQSKYPQAEEAVRKALASTTDAKQITEANDVLKQTLTAWLQWLRMRQSQLEGEVKLAEQQVAQQEKILAEDKKALKDKEDAENKVYTLHTGYWFDGHWHHHTRRGTGDPNAQNMMNQLQLKIMTATTEYNKRVAVRDRLQKEQLSITQYIPLTESKLQQVDAHVAQASQAVAAAAQQQQQGKLKILKATFGTNDVTAFVQGSATADSATVRAAPESFGISQANVGVDKLSIEYSLGEEKKIVTVDYGWTVTLPTLKLVPPVPVAQAAPPPVAPAAAPPQAAPFVESVPRPSPPPTPLPPEPAPIAQDTLAPDLPWYKDWRWIAAGVLGVILILRFTVRG